MNINVKVGVDIISRHYMSDSITIADVVEDVKAEAGLGDNVKILINGVEQPMHARVPDGATLCMETRCNSKAALLNPVLV